MAARNKANATAGKVANGVSKLLAMNDPMQAETIRDNLAKHSKKQAQSITPLPSASTNMTTSTTTAATAPTVFSSTITSNKENTVNGSNNDSTMPNENNNGLQEQQDETHHEMESACRKW